MMLTDIKESPRQLHVEDDHSLPVGFSEVRSRGWAECISTESVESAFREHLITLAAQLGTPVATRASGNVCETLKPTDAHFAHPHSLSGIYSLGEFPLHSDTAHWMTPCRFLIVACLSPGSGNRPSLLLDTQQLALDQEQISLLQRTPLRVTNGRNSFFSTILAKNRPFVRFDPGCMTPLTADGRRALAVFSKSRWPDHVETIYWHEGKVLVIDNWRLLHGRGKADCSDSDRTLLRVSIR